MRLTDLNRDGGIGANSLLLEIGPFSVAVDCGLHPKKLGPEALPNLARLRDVELDLVVLTHCHLDHVGALPVLLREHARPPVLMSVPSLHLAERMLHNSANVMQRQRESENRADAVLFSHDDVEWGASRFFGQAFRQVRRVTKGGDTLEVSLHPAGHVAGAAAVEFGYKHRRLLVSGDVLFTPQETIGGAQLPEGVFDTVVVETTRGATEREPGRTRETEMQRLVASIDAVLAGGGSVLLPVFALGRMQEVMCVLHNARREGRLRAAPIHAAGLGLAVADLYDEIARKTTLVRFSRSTLKALEVLPAPRDMAPGKAPARPGIYVLSSGMMVENTPSYAMAASVAGSPRCAVFFVGYCDPDTPGGQLLATPHEGLFQFRTLEFQTPLRAKVDRFDLSGHADREELLDFALQRAPRTVVLTHGDPPARAWFKRELDGSLGEGRTIDPVPGKTYVV